MTLGNSKRIRISGILGMCVLAVALIMALSVACGTKGKTDTTQATQEPTAIKEGLNEFAGMVKVASNKYIVLAETLPTGTVIAPSA